MIITIAEISVKNLVDKDGSTTSDPYVVVSAGGVDAQTSTKWNTEAAKYSDTLKLELPYGTVFPFTLNVRVMDKDTRSADDLCGECTVNIDAEGKGSHIGDLYPKGNVGFVWTAVTHAAPGKAVADEGGRAVTRCNIMTMSEPEQERFVAALKKMMQNETGPETSEFARIAGYHGYPSQFCHHGQETFPGWHRAYLVEFERALQRADEQLGNDGKIGLPYWDWEAVTSDDGGAIMPTIIRRDFTGKVPDGLVKPDFGKKLFERGFDKVRSDSAIRQRMQNARVVDGMYASLQQSEHWAHASTRFRRGYSIEDPHNDVHVAIGYPMSSVQFAAFHPIFWLHHCQVDRVYQKYIQLEGADNCRMEMIAQQRMLAERGDKDRWILPLKPFKHPTTGDDFMCADTFSTKELGYTYDELPSTRPPRMEQMPTHAIFVGMNPTAFAECSYTLHIFVFKTADACHAFVPPGNLDNVATHENYAGETNIFGGRGAECENCIDREMFDRSVNVTRALNRLNLSRHDCSLYVLVESDHGEIFQLNQVPAIPAPILTGPVFESIEGMLSATDGLEGSTSGDVRALQVRLQALGFFVGECDGWFGAKTTAAVLKFQAAFKLTQDAIAGPTTKGMLVKPLNDAIPHVGSALEPRDFPPGTAVTYWVGEQPGYLPRDIFLKEVAMAFAAWAGACGLTFVLVDEFIDAKLKITFDDFDGNKDVTSFDSTDGEGGMLAQATAEGVVLDPAERWLLRGKNARPARARTSYELLTVLTHEIGHVLGLPHTFESKDVMFPYYAPGKARLSKTEKIQLAAMYPKKGGRGKGDKKSKACVIL